MWITWVPPSNGIATFHTRGSSFDTVLAVYIGSTVSQLQEVASDDDGAEFFASEVKFNATAGQPYQIAIDGVYGSEGDILLSWNLDATLIRLPQILQPPVDAVVNLGGRASFSVGAINPPPATGALSYEWCRNGLIIPGATSATYTIPAVSFADLGLYFVSVANQTATVLSTAVLLQINFTDGTVNRQVSSEDKFSEVPRVTQSGAALHSLAGKPIPLGGSVARGYTGTQIFSTAGSTREAGEPTHCGVALAGASQWFTYLAEANGQLTIDTDGSDFDTVLAVYTGTGDDFASLTNIACDNNSGADGRDSRVSFPATAGTLYFIAIDGVARPTGTAQLHYRLDAPSRLQATLVNQQLNIRLTGPAGQTLQVQSSPDLRTWTTVLTTNLTTGIVDWLTPISLTDASQFFRASQGSSMPLIQAGAF
jgi:hypothetical protein